MNVTTSDITSEWAPDPSVLPVWFAEALAVPREEGFVTVDGVRLHYFRWGNPAAPPVLMTHGFLSHARCFAFVAPFLARDYHVVAYDLSGMGDSDVRPDCDMAARGRELIGVAEALGLLGHARKPILAAHSFGSAVALTAIELAPTTFGGAVICDMMVLRPSELEKYRSNGRTSPGSGDPNRPHRRYPDYLNARARYVLSPPQPVGEPFLMDYMAYHALRREGTDWTWKFSPDVFKRDNSQRLWLEIGLRLVAASGRKAIIHGEKSQLFTRDSRQYLRELGGRDIPIIAVPEARHHLMLDQPLAFTAALRAVIEEWSIGD
ncbi:alpha/beta hydrolase family protein (plasmid) [Blastomonas sp. RAC04]|uniref:alpha/beta fold hydrolase n=1 Tax=Blastomonas sp. RAC04 TaxID=1842535 RepID=UPI0008571FC3|nr:alpha/beta hydrolase [Blastomonas sp. RAC04]AOG02588.1 alpha/beta hydrolase family protein [Blastomonas sp. RAC04]